jgi:hypothetical protein
MENVTTPTPPHTHTVPIEKVIERIQIKEIPVVETEERVVEVCVPPHVCYHPLTPPRTQACGCGERKEEVGRSLVTQLVQIPVLLYCYIRYNKVFNVCM